MFLPVAGLIGTVKRTKNGLIKAGNLFQININAGNAIKFAFGSGGILIQDNRGLLIYLNFYGYAMNTFVLKNFSLTTNVKIYTEEVNSSLHYCYITSTSTKSSSEISLLDFTQAADFELVDVTEEQISNFTEIF